VKEEYRKVFEDPEGSKAIRKGHADSNGDKSEEKSCISRVNGTQYYDEKDLIQEGRPSIEPSDPSNKNLEDSSTIIPKSIYRLGHSDTWACHNCKLRGDKWFMQKHDCKGAAVKK
jgi:hypothetical protein